SQRARQLARNVGGVGTDGAEGILRVENSFHERTLATTAATGQAYYQATWVPIPDGFKQVPFNDLEALKAATSEKTVAVLLEAVQGEGGIWTANKEYIQGVRQWCGEQNVVMICDE